MAVVCAIIDSALEKEYVPLNAPWLYSDDHPDDNPSANGGITWAFALLTYVFIYSLLTNNQAYSNLSSSRFQDLVPISLYLSIEVVRTIQAIFIYFDKDIAYDRPGQPPQATQARSWNLSDDLGQIEYIFSDKTGTLTQVLSMKTVKENHFIYIFHKELHGFPTMFHWRQSLPR